MSIGPITRANVRRLQEATNELVKEFIWAISLQEEVPNTCLNQKDVGSSQEGKAAHFVLEVEEGNEGEMCTF